MFIYSMRAGTIRFFGVICLALATLVALIAFVPELQPVSAEPVEQTQTITYDKINRAYNLLKRGKTFIATHPDDLCPTEDGYDIDIGPFIRMFEQMSGTSAIVIGKPNRSMLEMAASEMDCDIDDIVMVGDRLYTDIRMAVDAGVVSVAVLSGETTEKDIAESPIKPTFVCNSVIDILSVMESANVPGLE